ncbi:MAG: hypothetical protein KBS64_01715 [Treponema sp.]|nr:hypothetical protein [Candidatus Treponema equi]
MKRLAQKKAFLVFYAFDIILLLVIGILFLPFSRSKNKPSSMNSPFVSLKDGEEITEIKILDRHEQTKILMASTQWGWLGTDSWSDENLYWPVEEKTVRNFISEITRTGQWIKKADRTTSWESLGVDNGNAVEVILKSGSMTVGHVFYGLVDDLEGKVAFRTSKDSTVWQAESSVVNFIYEKDSSFWADPYLVPVCARNPEEAKNDAGLRRGQLVYLKPAEHIKPFDTMELEFDYGVKAYYAFYEKDDAVVVIPSFEGNDYLKSLNYRYSISRWTYDRFIKEFKK